MSYSCDRSAIVLTGMVLLSMIMWNTAKSTIMRCEEAKLRCAYRTGCGSALQHYLTGCAPVLQGNDCSETCQHALIALTSTDEGKELITCECEDDLCLESKQRVEICRSSVQMAMNRTRVSCRVATWICNADALCQTALSYYNRFCKSMFQGRKCTRRCKNSINILTRQEKAAKLNTCQCDGFEDYDCKGIHRNMNLLCFGKIHHGYRDINIEDDRRNEFLRPNMTVRGDAVQILVDRRIFLLCLVIYHILKARQGKNIQL
ncbi:growth arrest-specific protein 1 isoform X3 [Megalopta genalis]|uniref:growth arrest-specific protein 1 isoform X3 n=1 Tax=Megalopta genalis TaxID=115081 RepID=UPI0014435EBE|nr:growth arrest-specific protein 1-like isoform X1 [Megalopta genalis]XP_033333095.1 growth arrest-specific protein 1-like isoform X1 [Megalopta genalis]XP_033333096.1 growth arrest-specific protein 1-like isoform X1 [Megalopta genalis]